MPESTLSVREVATATGYTKRQIYILAERGEIPSKKIDSFLTLPASVISTLTERRSKAKRGLKSTGRPALKN